MLPPIAGRSWILSASVHIGVDAAVEVVERGSLARSAYKQVRVVDA